MERKSNSRFLNDPINNDVSLLEESCCIVMNDNYWYLCRADIPMDKLENDELSLNQYADLVCYFMYSPLDEDKRKFNYSPLTFAFAMQSAETLHLYFYKFKFFDENRRKMPILIHTPEIANAEVLLWKKEFHNFEGVNNYNFDLSYDCRAYYESMDEFLNFFNILGIPKSVMQDRIMNKLRQSVEKNYLIEDDFDEDDITDESKE